MVENTDHAHDISDYGEEIKVNTTSALIGARFDDSEIGRNKTGIIIIVSGIFIIFIVTVILVIHRVIKVKEARDIKNRNRSSQFIGAIYKNNSVSSRISSNISSAPNGSSTVTAFDNPTFASSPTKKRRKESGVESIFECELINMDEIDLSDQIIDDEVDIIMAEDNNEDFDDLELGHRRSVSWS